MRKVFSLASFVAALAIVALLTLSVSGPVFAQGGTGTATPTTDTDTAATTTGSTTGSTGNAPGTLPNTAEGDPGPIAPPIVFILLAAILGGAVLLFALAARRNV